ncbi:MAG: hypothetical protein DLM52_11780 [Chthoniobacterales bacterium]|nr:MAG: hypothetical protein DLM52_11780 [Chthoniobacterales bacterium]
MLFTTPLCIIVRGFGIAGFGAVRELRSVSSQAAVRALKSIGTLRRRFPVALKTALVIAGMIGGTGGEAEMMGGFLLRETHRLFSALVHGGVLAHHRATGHR